MNKPMANGRNIRFTITTLRSLLKYFTSLKAKCERKSLICAYRAQIELLVVKIKNKLEEMITGRHKRKIAQTNLIDQTNTARRRGQFPLHVHTYVRN